MNVQEMHIEVDLSAQKIRSNSYRQLLDSEVDWILNKMVDRFIKDRIKQDTDSYGFDATEVDMDALRTLVVLDRELQTYQVETDATRAELPGNYSFLIDDFSYTIDRCNITDYNKATQFVNTIIYVYSLPLNTSSLLTGPYYKDLSVTVGGNQIFNAQNLPGLYTADEQFTVRDYILSRLWWNVPDNVDFYWERFDRIYSPGTILVISTQAQLGENSITIDGSTVNATMSTFSRSLAPDIGTGKFCNDRLVRGHFRSSLRSSAFARTLSTSPISAVSENYIKVYHDGKFIVSKLKASYVRKPARISLLLNNDCDLAPEFHQEICDRAVLYIKEMTNNPDWEVKLRDMMMNKD